MRAPSTLGIDIGVIKMILTHAAAVHGLEISPESVDLACVATLLHQPADDRTAPIPGQAYPVAFATGMPSAVKRFSTATRTWSSAT